MQGMNFSASAFLFDVDNIQAVLYYYVIRYIVMHNIATLNNSGGEKMPYQGGPMTEAMFYVLLALINPSHGYHLMEAIEEVSGGRVLMGPGTLYGVLARLEKDKLISMVKEDSRRKTYQLTDDGRLALLAEQERIAMMVRDFNAVTGGLEWGQQ
jgi:DNA-binding PadR family transcriptional regulator